MQMINLAFQSFMQIKPCLGNNMQGKNAVSRTRVPRENRQLVVGHGGVRAHRSSLPHAPTPVGCAGVATAALRSLLFGLPQAHAVTARFALHVRFLAVGWAQL